VRFVTFRARNERLEGMRCDEGRFASQGENREGNKPARELKNSRSAGGERDVI
jgi:hypothetical protein